MSAPARPARRGRCFVARATAAYILIGLSAPAVAEVGATASIFSEARLRGYSLSAGHPVAQLDLSYDDSGGLYGNLSGNVVYSREYGLRILGLQENVGYAKQLKGGPVLDVGLINANYSKYTGYQKSTGYTEVYAGLIGKVLSSHVYLSPNYFHSDTWTAYGDVSAGIRPLRKLRLSARVGARVPLRGGYSSVVNYDWEVAATREAGPLSLHLMVSDGGPGRDYYEGKWHGRRSVMAGATFLF